MGVRKHWALHAQPVCPKVCPLCDQPARAAELWGWPQVHAKYAPCGCQETVPEPVTP